MTKFTDDFLDNAFKDLRDIKLFPSIGMKRPHAHLSVNFGQKPFVFNIDGMMSVSTVDRIFCYFKTEYLFMKRRLDKALGMKSVMPTFQIYILLSARMICARLWSHSICHMMVTWRLQKLLLPKFVPKRLR